MSEALEKIRNDMAEITAATIRIELSLKDCSERLSVLEAAFKEHERLIEQAKGALKASKAIYAVLGIIAGSGAWEIVGRILKH